MPRKRLPPKPAKPNPNPLRQSPGRPPLDISKDEILKLARCGWTLQKIADFFDCDRDAISRRVSTVELNAARHERGGKLLEAMYARAMGGKIEKKLDDGTIQITYLKSSDKMMSLAAKYYIGLPTQIIEMNPDPDRPAQVKQTVDPEALKDAVKNAITELDSEY